jgi:hypothetical protein
MSMASKNLLDSYQIDLGNYYKATMAKYFLKYPGGEAGFLESLMVFPEENSSCSTRQAENAMTKFNDEYGQYYGVTLNAVGFDTNLSPIYYLSFWLIFGDNEYGDDFAQFTVGAQSYFDHYAYQTILNEVSDEELSRDQQNLRHEYSELHN